MGAFCVFGVSLTACKAEAHKKQPTKVKGRELTMVEFAAKRDELAITIFEAKKRAVKVSPEFDAPQFCESWLAVDPSHIRLAKIMARGQKIDKKGKVVVRNGVPVITWIEYNPAESDPL